MREDSPEIQNETIIEEPANGPGADKRRSTRISKRLAITITSVDTLGESFRETTHTVGISCHGCRYITKRYVPKGSRAKVEYSAAGLSIDRREIEGKVVWVRRPSHYKETFEVSIEFDEPKDLWGIPNAPQDWRRFSGSPAPDDSANFVLKDFAAADKDAGARDSLPIESSGKRIGIPLSLPAFNSPAADTFSSPEPPVSASNGESVRQEIGEICDITRIGPEFRDAEVLDGIRKTIEETFAKNFQPAMATSIQQLADPLAAAIAEKVAGLVISKIEHKIEESLQGAISKLDNEHQHKMKRR